MTDQTVLPQTQVFRLIAISPVQNPSHLYGLLGIEHIQHQILSSLNSKTRDNVQLNYSNKNLELCRTITQRRQLVHN